MERDPRKFLWDARAAADAIMQFTRGKTRNDYVSDALLHSAVERQFEIIGEALAQLARNDPALAARVPEYRRIIAFRNILVHGYAVLDRARVWRRRGGRASGAARGAERAARGCVRCLPVIPSRISSLQFSAAGSTWRRDWRIRP